MSRTGMPEFDTSVQEANVWLNDVIEILGRPEERIAYHALRGVLHALRDRLPVGEVFDVSAQLPVLVRGIFFEGYRPAGKPEKFGRERFIERVNDELGAAGGHNPNDAIAAVFATLNRLITRGELDQVRAILPEDLRILWPAPAAVAGT